MSETYAGYKARPGGAEAMPKTAEAMPKTAREAEVMTCIADIVITILSVVHTILGGVTQAKQMQYLGITADHLKFTDVIIASIVLGILIFIVAFFKSILPICCCCCCPEKSNIGTWIVALLTFISLFLHIGALTNGIVTAQQKIDNAENEYKESSMKTFLDYNNTKDQWDPFQIEFECCGVSSAYDYAKVFNNDHTVPEACCNRAALTRERIICFDVARNFSANDVVLNRIYNQGCADVATVEIRSNFGKVAGSSIALALFGVSGLLSFEVVYKSKNALVIFSGIIIHTPH